VTNFGRIESDQKLAQLYAAADTLLLPSVEDNLPNVMIESMCCETPVLAFNTGGFPDAVEDGVTGKLLPTGDTRAFGKAIVELSQNGALRGVSPKLPGRNSGALLAFFASRTLYESVSQRPRKTKDLLVGRLECSGRNFFASEY
jgi:glycosyltransferase involved in cell wall biosynthesis